MEIKQHPNQFLFDTYQFQTSTKILKIEQDQGDDKNVSFVFESTIFHPQGGGQPSDEGYIICNGNKIQVQGLTFNRDIDTVFHKISKQDFEQFKPKVGDAVQLFIDEAKRRLHAKLHSGGHLLDLCIDKLKMNWDTAKGYHFPDGAYVEYIPKNNWDSKKQEEYKQQLNEISAKAIQSTDKNDMVFSKIYEYEEGKKVYAPLPAYLPEGKPFRYVKLNKDDKGWPCGGTHVKHVSEIGAFKVQKLQKKGKYIRVYYDVK